MAQRIAQDELSNVVLREVPAPAIADPGPIGLAGFAMTTFVLSVFNAGIFSTSLEPVVFPIAFFYGGMVQLLAGMWEFRKNNTFGALAFSSYGAFWISFGLYAVMFLPGLPAASAAQATGLFLTVWGFFTLYMMVASFRTTGAIAAVFVVLVITYGLLAVAEFAGLATWGTAGGYAGIVDAILAWYASMAGVINSTWKRVLLPVFPLTGGVVAARPAAADGARADVEAGGAGVVRGG